MAARAEVEQAYASEQQRLARVARAVADRREGLARLAGQVAAKASRIEAAEGELGRMRDTVEAARSRAAQAEREFAALESSIAAEEAGEEDLDAGYEQAAAHLDRLEAELEELREQERVAERDRQSAAARVEALELSLRRKDGAAALLAAGDGTHTISGSVASLLQVEAGHEVAVAAALGWAGDALAVDTLAGAAAAVGRLRSDDAGRAGLLVPETAGVVDRSEWPALPSGARWALEVVSCSERLRPAVDRLLERVALVDGVDAAASLARDGITAVTVDGDVFGPGWVRGGSAAAPSLIEIQAAVDEAGERVAEASGRAERTRFAMAALRTRVAEASDTVESALDQLHDSDAKMSAVAEKLGALGVAVRSARAEAERTERGIAAAEAAVAADRAEHGSLAERYEAAVAQTGPTEDTTATPGTTPPPTSATASTPRRPERAPTRPSCGWPSGPGRSAAGRCTTARPPWRPPPSRRSRPAPGTRRVGSVGCARRRWPRPSGWAPPTPRRSWLAPPSRPTPCAAGPRRPGPHATRSSACCGATSPSSRTSCAS